MGVNNGLASFPSGLFSAWLVSPKVSYGSQLRGSVQGVSLGCQLGESAWGVSLGSQLGESAREFSLGVQLRVEPKGQPKGSERMAALGAA